jgi:hypothetical protein
MPVQPSDLILIERSGTPFRTTAGAVAALNSGGGGGGGGGSGEVDFGPFPGAATAQLVITGQDAIAATSLVQAWLTVRQTADHSADEHEIDPPTVRCGALVPGVGFTIFGGMPHAVPSVETGGRRMPGRAALIYGRWSVQWRWQ